MEICALRDRVNAEAKRAYNDMGIIYSVGAAYLYAICISLPAGIYKFARKKYRFVLRCESFNKFVG